MKPTGRPALHRIKPSPWRLAPGRSSLARPACAAAVLMAGLLAGLAALLLAIPAAAFPPLSPPIALDHGFRFHDPCDATYGCALTVDRGRVLLTYRDLNGGGVTGARRTLTGGEIDIAPRCLIGST